MAAMRKVAEYVWLAVMCAGLQAQSQNVIHIRLLDGKTGQPIAATNFLVRVDHHDTNHNEWVHLYDDGTVTVALPAATKVVALKATYEMGMATYINCDAAKETDKERDVWYPVDDIMKRGVVAPNECSKTEYTAKPGEFVFFVRKRNWREQEDF